MKPRKNVCFALLVCLFFVSCKKLERDNPLDEKSKGYTPCVAPAIINNPSVATQSREQGIAFSELYVQTEGTTLSCQWYSTTTNNNTSGTAISGANDFAYTPSSVNIGRLYYYCVITNLCGTMKSKVSGEHIVTEACTTAPTITTQPYTTTQTREQGLTFSALSVTATGVGVTCQWYSNTHSNNTSGIAISGAINSTYIPSSVVVGTLYYYCVVSNSCGMVKSNVSGAHNVITPTVIPGCNMFKPGFTPDGNLGEPYFKTNQIWPISGSGISQTWSDVVLASGCNKTSYSGGMDGSFDSDCRSNITTGNSAARPTSQVTSSNYYGDLFSWCAVMRFKDQLCPDDWRVPTTQDFVDLDKALGGTGNFDSNYTVFERYSTVWGSSYGGYCNNNRGISDQGLHAYYWAQTSHSDTHGRSLYVWRMANYTDPQSSWNKRLGIMVRCVRDN